MRGSHLLSRSTVGKKLLDIVSRSVLLQRLLLGGPNPVRPWETEQRFQSILKEIRRLSLNRPPSLFNLYQLALTVREVPGDVAEIGVYKGGTARLLARQFSGSGKSVLLFDTFTGMPSSIDKAVDHWNPGDFSDTSLDSVRQVVADFPEATCIPGFFPESAQGYEDRRFAFVHIDVDIAQSVADCCEFFYPRLTPGGVMVFDDYGFRSCPGARKEVDDFFADRREHPIYLATGQSVVFRSQDASIPVSA